MVAIDTEAEGLELTILHFNDVYHISDPSLVAKFATVLKSPSYVMGDESRASLGGKSHAIRVFSGDAFSPSLEAAVLRGDHMAPVLDGLDIDVACYGNHDFDFGEDRLVEIAKQTRFPWTLANAVASGDADGQGRLLAGAHKYVIKDIDGYRIGFFGLAGTLSEKCDFVIAVTHMRLVEDLAVSQSTLSGPEKVDLILGGHDHHVVRRDSSDSNPDPEILQSGHNNDGSAVSYWQDCVRIIKSGTDWRGLSILKLRLGEGGKGEPAILNTSLEDLKELPNYDQIPPSQTILDVLDTTHDKIEKVVTQPLLYTETPLDGRTRVIRSQETNLGNMLADAVRAFYDTDIALVNSGAVRCDRIVECTDGAPLCIRDVIEISPFDNAFVVKRVRGRVLAEALENSVSDAHTDGRFLQLCGIHINLDWKRPEGQRVSGITFHEHDAAAKPLELDHMYTIAMVDFIGSGFDGYTCFKDCETLVDAEGAITDTNMILEIFKSRKDERDGREIADQHTDGIHRARAAIIRKHHGDSGLPIVSPQLEGRVKVQRDK
ncbi:hypothetical protein K4F52_002758 [Lecanicillium sp. MT-2017a]|nr:hypothetical protein K4F52_002758 [Lecanicillium sp. MT-2017a]